jgi:hypothetical protein
VLQGRSLSRGAVALLTGLVVAAVAAAPASAASTRAEYVAQADPICQIGIAGAQGAFVKFTKIVKKKPGGRRALRHPEVITEQIRMPASRLYRRLAAIYLGVNQQIAAIPPVPEDAPRVNSWLGLRATNAADLQMASRALKKKQLNLFDQLLIKGRIDATNANAAVADFGFRFCTAGNGAVS